MYFASLTNNLGDGWTLIDDLESRALRVILFEDVFGTSV
jgi:hypothetical protein